MISSPVVSRAEALHDGRGAAGLEVTDGQGVQFLVDGEDRVLAGQVDGGLVQVLRVFGRGGFGGEQIADHRRFSSYQMPGRVTEDVFPRLSQTWIFRLFRTPPATSYFHGETEPGRGIAPGGGHILVHVERAGVILSAAADAVRAVAVGDPDGVRNFAEPELEGVQPAAGPDAGGLPRQALEVPAASA